MGEPKGGTKVYASTNDCYIGTQWVAQGGKLHVGAESVEAANNATFRGICLAITARWILKSFQLGPDAGGQLALATPHQAAIAQAFYLKTRGGATAKNDMTGERQAIETTLDAIGLQVAWSTFTMLESMWEDAAKGFSTLAKSGALASGLGLMVGIPKHFLGAWGAIGSSSYIFDIEKGLYRYGDHMTCIKRLNQYLVECGVTDDDVILLYIPVPK
jgi:hypothetical protein